ILRELSDFSALDTECTEILQEMDVVSGLIKKLVNENAAQPLDQAAYIDRYNSLVERFENLQAEYDALQRQKERRRIQTDALSGCLFALTELDLLQLTFNEKLWNTVVDHVTVYADERLVFHFKNGSEITVQM
ncbi:MAG: recombinase, partial [Faecousia sp.]